MTVQTILASFAAGLYAYPCPAPRAKSSCAAVCLAVALSVMVLGLAGCASAPQGGGGENAAKGDKGHASSASILAAEGAAFKNMGKGQVQAPQVVVHAVEGWSSSHIRYQCDKGMTVLANYLNLEHNDSFVTLAFNNEQVLLRQVAAEAGARYVAVDELRSYRWHAQADEAVLSILPAQRNAQAETPIGRCQRAG